ncbi:hypothetical protein [Larkinella humicola]|uniref:Uncharacterized protein n=1 Tax=Larkinella humicola TaxID=2607654 RepID=A0A5N1JTZ3_9BACT|nr:hypothetical protein [Larkinella humicola]KAA9357273.1 hypothetical protein F0P93_05925 [Larkinella humicola]
MKNNAFRTQPPVSRYQPEPAKVHATPRTPPRRVKMGFWARIKKRDHIASALALAGVTYLLCRFALGVVVSKRIAELTALGTVAAVLMLVSALLLTIDSGRDNHRMH